MKKYLFMITYVILFIVMLFTSYVYAASGEGMYQAISIILVILLFNVTGIFVDTLKGEDIW